jgi:hypothetical protein
MTLKAKPLVQVLQLSALPVQCCAYGRSLSLYLEDTSQLGFWPVAAQSIRIDIAFQLFWIVGTFPRTGCCS